LQEVWRGNKETFWLSNNKIYRQRPYLAQKDIKIQEEWMKAPQLAI
jgi:hypothetical protein